MPIDPWIPLAGRPFDPSSGLTLGLMGQRYRAGNLDIQQAAAENQRQNQLRALLGNMTPQGQGGQYAPNQLQQMMALDPKLGLGLGQQQFEQQRETQLLDIQKKEAEYRLSQLANPTESEIEAMTQAQVPATKAYLSYKKNHPQASEEELNAVAQKSFDKSYEDLGQSGTVRTGVFARFPAKYSYDKAEFGIRRHAPAEAASLFPLTEVQRAEKGLDEPKSDIGRIENDYKKGIISRAEADARIKKLDQPPVSVLTAQADKDMFGGRRGKLLGALVEAGVPLPAGFRSKAQQAQTLQSLLERNPDLSEDEIAQKVAAGQIKFGAEKKETQIAAGQAGKVAVAVEEIPEFGKLVVEASDAIPRGKFVPWNKLRQMSEENISDPALIKFKTYMTSLNNAYDNLAARGGTDAEKRAYIHNLFDTAKSPEGVKTLVDALTVESQKAQKAARKAMQPSGSGGSDSKYVETRTTPDGRRLGKKADGTIEVIQ